MDCHSAVQWLRSLTFIFFLVSVPVQINKSCHFLQKCVFSQFQEEPRFLGASQQLEITVLKI